ncbi:TPM domain-containing protein [Tamlana sp. 2_MG-2023]|uniref:TPM domain-containing protein n=1 Tax=unclassified Tamlana TaxID=2614803 RepID=UPI0026E2015D|nr:MULTISPECIES: TPM domain-containing protein [unclassified Tamlana]MDO6761379.1 TPM domain-containing protein [Tamlana sp. 2_MG-2023]MDO6792007.1 TPM domain-containing protein [Tamlana sp. 1_MG-2023]
MSKNQTEDFLTAQEEQEIIEAIQEAELNTSGELRVHIEKTAKGDATNRALEVFHHLKMDNTKLQNAVLIYVAVEDKSFVIYGDEGINNAVESDFWDCTKDIMQAHFKKGDFKQGLVDGILRSGDRLKKYFPYQSDDINELSDEISKG